MPSRCWITAAVALAMLALGGCEDDFIEVCTPTSAEITEASTGAVEVELRSGDRPLRGKDVQVQVAAGGEPLVERVVEVDADGTARIEFTDPAPVGADVTARFPADDVYCESSATGEINRVGTDQP